MDAQRNGLAGDLLAGDTVDVDHVLETVDGGDLALTALATATDDSDLVILANGDAADLEENACQYGGLRRQWAHAGSTYVVLLAELLGQGRAHDVAANRRRGREVSLSRLASRAGGACENITMSANLREKQR